MTPIRLLLRDAAGRLLKLVPLAWFEPLRRAHRSRGVRAAAAGLLLRRIRYRPVDRDIADFPIRADRPLRLVNDGSLIAGLAYWLGPDGYEPAVARRWAACCARARRILEIGANIGYMTVWGAAAAPDTPYTAVEPNPEAARSLRRNCRLNGLSQVKVIEAAVVGVVTRPTLTLCLSLRDAYAAPTGAHLAAAGAPAGDERGMEVAAVGVDGLLDGVDLLKIDAEGAELDILSAAARRLAAQRCIVIVEALDGAAALREFLGNFVRRHQYRAAVLRDPPVEIDAAGLARTPLEARYGSRDLLLVPAERAAGILRRP
jgi:FkbM family methyltransferase